MLSKIKIGYIRLIIIILFCLAIGILVSYKFTGQKSIQKKAPIVDEHLIKDRDTQAVIKQFEKKVYSEGKLLYKLVSEYATYSPTSEKRLITLENILPDTVFFNTAGGEYHLTASKGEMDEITHNTAITGNIKVTSQDGLSFETKSVNYIGADNILFSNDRFHISGRGLDVDGLGFKIYLDKRTVEMVNRVKTQLAASKNFLEADDIKSIPETIKNVENSNQKLYIESNKFKYDDNSGTVSYNGNVFIIYDRYFINCDGLDIHLDEKRRKFITLVLHGNIHISDEKEAFKGVCQKIVYDILNKKAEFSGNPKIWSFSNTLPNMSSKTLPLNNLITLELPTIKNKLPFYPIIQRKITKFITAFYSRQIPKYEIMIENTLSLLADRTITGDSMSYQADSFNVRGNVYGTFSLNKITPSLIDDDMLNSIPDSFGEKLSIRSNSFKYDFKTANIEFQDQVKVEKGKDSINSNHLVLKIDNINNSIQEFTFKNEVKSTFFISSEELEKISKDSNKKVQPKTGEKIPLKINSNELLYSSSKNSLQYKDNVEIYCEDSFLLCDNLFILQNPKSLEFETVQASGNVRSKNKDTIFSGEHAEFLKDKNMMHLYGSPKVWLQDNTITGKDIYYFISKDQYKVEDNVSTLLFLPDKNKKSNVQNRDKKSDIDFKSDTVLITSDSLLFNGEEQYAEYIGNVKIESEDLELTAKSIKIFMNKDNSDIERILARDDVNIKSGEFAGTGDNALYIDKMNKIILSGSPKIYQSDKLVSTGKEVTIFIDQKKIEIDSGEDDRVKTTLFIKSDEDLFGFDKKRDKEKK